MWKLAPELNFGVVGVKCFFVISGFLVTQSWLSRRDPVGFVTSRVLRIYPALIAATLLTIVLAGASSTLPWGSFLTHRRHGTTRGAWRWAGTWCTGCQGHFPSTRFHMT
ncbi:MAG: acyltransferase family protein [Casimicrobiaceae bacterium]